MSKDQFDLKYEILMKEWDYARTHIGRFDTIIFQIRSWTITAITGLVAVSETQNKPRLMLLGVLITFMFWLNDSVQKSFQRIFIIRSREIANYLSGELFRDDVKNRTFSDIEFPAVELRFGSGTILSRSKSVLKAALLRNVILIYGTMTLFCVASYFILRCGMLA